MTLKKLGILFLFLLGLSAQSQNKSESLINSDELFQGLSGIRVIDISSPEDFEESNIFSSVNISRSDFTDNSAEIKGLMASKESLEELLSNFGIQPSDEIVLYDHKGGCDAARLWWILKVYGHENLKILDGGLKAWGDKNDLISPWLTNYEYLPYVFENVKNESIYASLDEVKSALEDPNTILIDTRTFDEYTGRTMKDGAHRSGRIPGSIHIDWAENVDYHGDQEIKPLEQLLEIYESKGITKEKNIICYCQSGARSTHNSFILTQILGYPNVSNYDGSWIEWSSYSELAIDTGLYIRDRSKRILQECGLEREDIDVSPAYSDVFFDSFGSFWAYTWSEITFDTPLWYVNYFWWLVILSLLVWALEMMFPWRKNQAFIRKDFWLDVFYMFFNFYIFKIIIFMAFSNVTALFFTNLIGGDLSSWAIFDTSTLGWGLQLLIFFLALDFIQWFTHVLLHRFDFLWRFHKVHHSVEEMGFAAHLRFHWMENIFYTPMKFIIMMIIGNFGPEQAFMVYYISIAIGHFNHANIGLGYGPFKYILNNPKMHIWHHAHELPKDKSHGVNFGISLSIWDYIFRTNYIPSSGRDIKLGFEELEDYPKSFLGQLFSGWRK